MHLSDTKINQKAVTMWKRTCTFSAENYLDLIIKTENVQRPGNNFEYIQISSLLQNNP